MNNWQMKNMQLVVTLLSTLTVFVAVVSIAVEAVFLLDAVEMLKRGLHTMLLVRF